ncbi:aspartate carbamoyltransferase catalytic subunit [Bacillus piscicola]|uniref:aspartate carbamoyltransferase catalytic subunit n=1 Tax=Bacillus piscicola TaxID=1632684 RepID=UPI001F09B43D|nr:aspartate carbamoyltransferase catalytic subunit [Bacillus piscicola]
MMTEQRAQDTNRQLHILRAEDWEAADIHTLLTKAESYAAEPRCQPIPKRLFAVNLFYEPSTRTKISFEAAERNLGLEILPFDVNTSSVCKGESLYDTVKTIESVGADVIVIRHSKERYFEELQDRIKVPIINGGDGCGDHPTQTLLDLMTIYQEFKGFKGRNVVITGDIRHSRVARSHMKLLKKLGALVHVSGPPAWIPEEYMPMFVPIDDAVRQADVMMMLRIQNERHRDNHTETKASYYERYGLTLEREQVMKKNSIIMHPGPVNRGVEIASELVECSRSRIFRQMTNGVFARMAVLTHVLKNARGGKVHE